MAHTTTLGGYALGEALGQGAMGTVYRGEGPDGSLVAVKLLHIHLTSIDEFVRRFKREASLAAKLAHPNVVKVLDHGEDEGQHYIVMEYVRGRSLTEYLQEAGIEPVAAKSSRSSVKADSGEAAAEAASAGPPVRNLPVEEVIRILRQVSGVLQAAHDIGLVHRDLKPQNILIDPSGNAKVLDFGLAKDTDALTSMLSMTGQSIGTPPYMSPEQCEGLKEIDVRSDLYSLGATAYQMLTGRAPFPGPTASAFHLQHREEIPEPVCKVNPAIPENLSQVVDRLLAKRPEDRHQSPAELIEDLNRVERGEVPLKLYKPKKARKSKPIHTVIAVVTAIALCIGAFAGWSYYQRANADGAIQERISQAQFAIQRGQLQEALGGLDRVIADFQATKPELIAPAVTLRKQVREQLASAERAAQEAAAAAERERLAQQRDLVSKGDSKLQEGAFAEALALYQAAAALGSTEEIVGKLKTATTWKAEADAKAAEAARLAREETERQRRADDAERERRLSYEQALAKAARLLNDGDPDTLDEARAEAAKARERARSEDEIKPAVALQDQVAAALAQRRPWVAVVDFLVDGSVKVEITGTAVAVKLEQELAGGYRLVTRSQVAKALQELQFQSSDLADQAKARRFGQLVGAEFLVTGSVVQIGREITIAAQIFRVESGAIRQTAQVNTDRLDALNDLFAELSSILQMTDEEKQIYIAEQRDYPRHLADGKALAAREQWAEAVTVLERARRAKKTPEVEALLATAREKAEEARIVAERKAAHDLALAEGSRLLREQQWTAAEAAFQRALQVPGHTASTEARQGLTQAQGGAARVAYDAAMTEATRLQQEKRWQDALASVNRALQVAGYTTDRTAQELQEVLQALASAEQALTTARDHERRGAWEAVATALADIPGYNRLAASGAAGREYRTAIEALREQADRHLTPRLTILSIVAGREVPGAIIAINGTVQEQTTPATYNLERGTTYAIKVSLAPRGKTHYTPFETTYRVDRNGRQELRAVLEEAQGPAVGQPWVVPELGMEFVWIETLGMWVGKYEVTNGEYRTFKRDHDSKAYEGHTLNGPRQPVVYVNFDDAMAYAKWLTERERGAGRLPAGWSYRLPLETEWETFAKCGDNRTYPWGNEWPPKYGNYSDSASAWRNKIDGYRDGHAVTCDVEKSGKNDWGLYGVGGNVWEVTLKDTSSFGAWRGASWYNGIGDSLRVSYRLDPYASDRYSDGGFRLVLSR